MVGFSRGISRAADFRGEWMNEGPSGSNRELQELARARRHVYIWGLLLVVGVLVCAWVVRSPNDTYRAVSAPIFVLLLLALVTMLWRSRVPLPRLELLILFVLAAMPLTRQLWLFDLDGQTNEQWLRMVGNDYWATSAVLVLVFTVVERRRALIAGVGILLASVAIAVTGVGFGLAQGEIVAGTMTYVAGALLFLTIFVVLMNAATIMRNQWQSALSRAAAYSHWAMTDMLTGLANRRAASELLARDCAAAARYGRSLSVILGDLDGFKQVNDTAGHAAGDAVLAGVAKILRDNLRESDVVARWGGEEFLIITPGTGLEQAREVAEQCRRAIADRPIAGVRITMTLGVAEYIHGDDNLSLVERADERLYLGKSTTRNRVEAGSVTPARRPHVCRDQWTARAE